MLATMPEEARPKLVAAALAGTTLFVELRQVTWHRTRCSPATRHITAWHGLDLDGDLAKLSWGVCLPGLYEIRVHARGVGPVCQYYVRRTKSGLWVRKA